MKKRYLTLNKIHLFLYTLGLFIVIIPQSNSSSPLTYQNYIRKDDVVIYKQFFYDKNILNYTVSISGEAFRTTPQITFAWKELIQYQYFSWFVIDVYIQNITNSNFALYTKITQPLSLFSIQYLAIQADFPAHLNLFQRVPFNETQQIGVVKSDDNISSTRTLKNNMNYTKMAQGRLFNKLSSNLLQNKIILFLSSFFIHNSISSFQSTIFIKFTTQVLNTQIITLNTTVSRYVELDWLYLSMLVYIQNTVDTSKIQVQFSATEIITSGPQIHLTAYEKYKNYTFLGLKTFSVTRPSARFTYFKFGWKFENQQTTNFGIYIYKSNSYQDAGFVSNGITSWTLPLFILIFPKCVSPDIYYNKKENICSTTCGENYTQYAAKQFCVKCPYNCGDCSLNSSTLKLYCDSCNSPIEHRYLFQKNCLCQVGYFQSSTGNNPNCLLCDDKYPYCLQCTYSICTKCQESLFYWNPWFSVCNINCSAMSHSSKQALTPYQCVCDRYYEWNKTNLQCQISCNIMPKSTGVQISIEQCLCSNGFFWNQTSSSCYVNCQGVANSPGTMSQHSHLQCNCLYDLKWNNISDACWRNCQNVLGSTGKSVSLNNCQCQQGKAWDSKANRCFKDCSIVLNSNGLPVSEYECQCMNGYNWSSQKDYCLINCSLYSESILSKLTPQSCLCKTPYVWNKQNKNCQLNCSQVKYTNYQSSTQSGKTNQCVCIQNFKWNQKQIRCQRSCFLYQNTNGQLQEGSVDRCSCQSGRQWNQQTNYCQNIGIDGTILAIIIIWSAALLFLIGLIAVCIYVKKFRKGPPSQIVFKSAKLGQSTSMNQSKEIKASQSFSEDFGMMRSGSYL